MCPYVREMVVVAVGLECVVVCLSFAASSPSVLGYWCWCLFQLEEILLILAKRLILVISWMIFLCASVSQDLASVSQDLCFVLKKSLLAKFLLLAYLNMEIFRRTGLLGDLHLKNTYSCCFFGCQ